MYCLLMNDIDGRQKNSNMNRKASEALTEINSTNANTGQMMAGVSFCTSPYN